MEIPKVPAAHVTIPFVFSNGVDDGIIDGEFHPREAGAYWYPTNKEKMISLPLQGLVPYFYFIFCG